MAIVRGLTVALDARSQRTRKELQKSNRDIKRYSRQARREFKNLARATRQSLVIATGAIAALGANALRTSDELAKASRNAGLGAREYQRLAHAFQISGASASTLTKASTSLSRQIYQLGLDSKEATDAFDALGLNFADIQNLTPGNALNLVLDRLRGVSDESQRTAVAMTLLGRAGKELGTVLETSGSDFAAIQDRFERLGGVIEGRLLNNAERFNDEMTVLAQVMRAQFATGILDAVGSTAEFDDTIRSLGEAARALGDGIARLIQFAVKHRDTIVNLGIAYGVYRVATSRLTTSVFGFARAIGAGGAVAAGGATLVGSLVALKAILVVGGTAGVIYGISKLREELNETFTATRDLNEEVRKSGSLWERFLAASAGGTSGTGLIEINITAPIREFNTIIDESLGKMKSFLDLSGRITGAGAPVGDIPSSRNFRSLNQLRDEDRRRRALAAEPGRRFRSAASETALTASERRELLVAAGATIQSQSQQSASRFGTRRGFTRGQGGQFLPGTVGSQIQDRLAGIEERNRQNAELEKTAMEFRDNLTGKFRSILGAADFSDLGDTLLNNIQSSLLEKASQGLADFFIDSLGFSGGGFLGGLLGFAEGGVVPGRRGEPRLAVVHGQERVLTPEERTSFRETMQSVVNNYTFIGDMDRAVRKSYMKLIPEISVGVAQYNREQSAGA